MKLYLYTLFLFISFNAYAKWEKIEVSKKLKPNSLKTIEANHKTKSKRYVYQFVEDKKDKNWCNKYLSKVFSHQLNTNNSEKCYLNFKSKTKQKNALVKRQELSLKKKKVYLFRVYYQESSGNDDSFIKWVKNDS